jgi:hypothetical protein
VGSKLIDENSSACAITLGQELSAVVKILQFSYDDGRTFLKWEVGNSVDPAV